MFIHYFSVIHREYALIRIKAAFRENKSITDSTSVANKIQEGYQNLDVIKRQVLEVAEYIFGDVE